MSKLGHGDDSRPNDAQVVLGFAVTRDGAPVRCWLWPASASDASFVEEVNGSVRQYSSSGTTT